MRVTALAEVTETGQKCTEVLLDYEEELREEDLLQEAYVVKNREILEAKVEGSKVHIFLNPEDEKAQIFHSGQPWQGQEAYLGEVEIQVKQEISIYTKAGKEIPPMKEFAVSGRVVDEVADQFIQGIYGKQKYNLFIPRDYDPGKKYPLIQFIHDAAVCGKDTRLTLTQGIGATIWATEEEQKKHPSFIFAPQFEGPPIVDDDWNVDPRLEEAKQALDYVIETYSIDENRIYTTGQSMGCMSSIVLNVRYPNLFAGSLLVAGQWDERGIPGLEKQNLWMICSQGDAKAFPMMNQMCVHMERAGAKVVRRVMENHLSQQEYWEIFREILREDANVIFTPLKLETVADGWHSNGGEHHVNTWQSVYQIEVLREWLFKQKRK